jgi:magnesium chelatase family protein
VNEARKIQQERFKNESFYNNSAMMTKHLKKYSKISKDSQKLMEMAINKFGLSI